MSARHWFRLDEDTGVLIKSIELVKIPLTFTRHRFRLSFTDSNLLMELAAVEPCVRARVWCIVRLECGWLVVRSENSCILRLLVSLDSFRGSALSVDLMNWNTSTSQLWTDFSASTSFSRSAEVLCVFTLTYDNPFPWLGNECVS